MSAVMTDATHDAAYYLRKAEEYREKACATTELRVRSALEAVAREYARRAYASHEAALSAEVGT